MNCAFVKIMIFASHLPWAYQTTTMHHISVFQLAQTPMHSWNHMLSFLAAIALRLTLQRLTVVVQKLVSLRWKLCITVVTLHIRTCRQYIVLVSTLRFQWNLIKVNTRKHYASCVKTTRFREIPVTMNNPCCGSTVTIYQLPFNMKYWGSPPGVHFNEIPL